MSMHQHYSVALIRSTKAVSTSSKMALPTQYLLIVITHYRATTPTHYQYHMQHIDGDTNAHQAFIKF
jgi:hypothetical protein